MAAADGRAQRRARRRRRTAHRRCATSTATHARASKIARCRTCTPSPATANQRGGLNMTKPAGARAMGDQQHERDGSRRDDRAPHRLRRQGRPLGAPADARSCATTCNATTARCRPWSPSPPCRSSSPTAVCWRRTASTALAASIFASSPKCGRSCRSGKSAPTTAVARGDAVPDRRWLCRRRHRLRRQVHHHRRRADHHRALAARPDGPPSSSPPDGAAAARPRPSPC